MARIVSLRRALALAGVLAALALLLAERGIVSEAVRQGLLLCAGTVIPSLFPFFTAVSFAVSCGLGELLPPAAGALTLGLTGGYPVGARTAALLLRQGDLDLPEARRLLCCCNNAGPAFILGVAGGVFTRPGAAAALWIIHLLSALLPALLLLRRKSRIRRPRARDVSLPGALVEAVQSSSSAMVGLCGFVVLFWVALQLLSALTPLRHPLLLGFIELTGGILSLPDSAAGFVMAAALLGWGGVSVHCQTAAALRGSGLGMGRYLAAKLIQALLSAALAVPVSRLLWP